MSMDRSLANKSTIGETCTIQRNRDTARRVSCSGGRTLGPGEYGAKG